MSYHDFIASKHFFWLASKNSNCPSCPLLFVWSWRFNSQTKVGLPTIIGDAVTREMKIKAIKG